MINVKVGTRPFLVGAVFVLIILWIVNNANIIRAGKTFMNHFL